MNKIAKRNIYTSKLVLFFVLLFAGFILYSGLSYAVEPPITLAQAKAVCARKADEAACLKEVNSCPKPVTPQAKSPCLRLAVSKGGVAAENTGFSTDALEQADTPNRCGAVDKGGIETSIDFGCSGTGSPIVDFAYAVVKFLSIGVGLVLVASVIYAGISYSASQGNPEATAQAKNRIINTMIALAFYLLIFAIIQYLVPGGLFNG